MRAAGDQFWKKKNQAQDLSQAGLPNPLESFDLSILHKVNQGSLESRSIALNTRSSFHTHPPFC